MSSQAYGPVLAEVLDRIGKKTSELAADLQLAEPRVTHFLTGRKKMDVATADMLEKGTGVASAIWLAIAQDERDGTLKTTQYYADIAVPPADIQAPGLVAGADILHHSKVHEEREALDPEQVPDPEVVYVSDITQDAIVGDSVLLCPGFIVDADAKNKKITDSFNLAPNQRCVVAMRQLVHLSKGRQGRLFKHQNLVRLGITYDYPEKIYDGAAAHIEIFLHNTRPDPVVISVKDALLHLEVETLVFQRQPVATLGESSEYLGARPLHS